MPAEIFKYLIAGGIAFLTDLTVLYACTDLLGIHYLQSNIFSYSCGLVVAYFLNTRWVFSYRRYAQKSRKEFLIFAAIALVGLMLSEAILLALVSQASVHYLHAKVVATFFVMVFNFIAKKFLLFHPKPQA
ncbi:MAG: GtrA family protein [Halioglobus sp.]